MVTRERSMNYGIFNNKLNIVLSFSKCTLLQHYLKPWYLCITHIEVCYCCPEAQTKTSLAALLCQ